MSMSNTSETAFLNLLFKNIAWANVGDASGLQPSATAGSFYIALHTTDPGDAGDQTTGEISYTGYARVAVVRGAGFTVSGDTISNAATVQYGECTAGTASVSWFTVGTEASGAGTVIYRGELGSVRAISAGITPLFNAGSMSGLVN